MSVVPTVTNILSVCPVVRKDFFPFFKTNFFSNLLFNPHNPHNTVVVSHDLQTKKIHWNWELYRHSIPSLLTFIREDGPNLRTHTINISHSKQPLNCGSHSDWQCPLNSIRSRWNGTIQLAPSATVNTWLLLLVQCSTLAPAKRWRNERNIPTGVDVVGDESKRWMASIGRVPLVHHSTCWLRDRKHQLSQLAELNYQY